MIRNIETTDYPAIMELNLESVHYLSPLGLGRLGHLQREAAYSKVIEDDGRIVAFILAFRKGAEYDSPNYIWFSNRYNSFIYIDRIVVHKNHRRKGCGEMLYTDLISSLDSETLRLLRFSNQFCLQLFQ